MLALLLILAIAPSMSELVELVIHYAAFGDVADHDGDPHGDRTPLGQGEHGCSGTFHLGSCHSGQPTTGVASTPTIADATAPRVDVSVIDLPTDLHGLGAAAPELRPPIA